MSKSLIQFESGQTAVDPDDPAGEKLVLSHSVVTDGLVTVALEAPELWELPHLVSVMRQALAGLGFLPELIDQYVPDPEDSE